MFAIALALASSTPYFTARELGEHCILPPAADKSKDALGALCEAYVGAVSDMLVQLGKECGSPLFCPSDKISVTEEKGKVLAYILLNSKYDSRPAAELAYHALIWAYPCEAPEKKQ